MSHKKTTRMMIVALMGALPLLFAPGAGAAEPREQTLGRLARDVDADELVRAVKRLQADYEQYAQYGLWDEMASLFADDGEAAWGDDQAKGPTAIADALRKRFGGDNFHAQLLFEEVVNLSPDGQTAKGRFRELSLLAKDSQASWAGGVMENSFVRQNGIWKIARLDYTPQFAGPYESGWHNVVPDLKLTPYHFNAEQAGTPIPLPSDGTANTKTSGTDLALLKARIAALNDEDEVHNLQNIYGYYVDRKMWDDVTDLFTADGVLDPGKDRPFKGVKNIRRALEIDGPAGLKHGEINDHIQIGTVVEISPGGQEAHARGLDLGILADADHDQKAAWSLSVFRNRYRKGADGKWRIAEVRIFPVMKTDFYQGWGKNNLVPASPDVPAFFANPVTGRPVVLPAGMRAVAATDLGGPIAAPARSDRSKRAAIIADARRALSRSIAYDAVENISWAFGDWIADFQSDDLGALFAEKGMRQYPIAGSYRGPARIAESEKVRNGLFQVPRTNIGPHIMAQPVIYVSSDGRSARYRTRNFQLGSSVDRPGNVAGGSYANNQAVLVNGVWKIWSIAIDEFYWQGDLVNGWSKWKPRPQGQTKLDTDYLPEISRHVLGKREEGIAGGPGPDIEFPDIKPMWFFYKNPVSGRTPPLYWPDCVTCSYDPSTSMKANGY